jgi:hypothetical protein
MKISIGSNANINSVYIDQKTINNPLMGIAIKFHPIFDLGYVQHMLEVFNKPLEQIIPTELIFKTQIAKANLRPFLSDLSLNEKEIQNIENQICSKNTHPVCNARDNSITIIDHNSSTFQTPHSIENETIDKFLSGAADHHD